MTNFYSEIAEKMKALFEPDKNVLTAWEGGSAATGYLDEYSDLDLGFIVKDESVEMVFEEMENFLSENYGIKNKFRMPEPNWHGHSQCFYILDKSPDYFYVDFLIEKESSGNRFMESNLHGNAIVWFDKAGLYDNSPEPENSYLPKCKHHFEMMTSYLPLTLMDLRKQLVRNNLIDACAIYHSMLNRFIALLNIKYRPAKHNFGMRYLYRDFPEHEIEFVEKLLNNSTIQQIEANLLLIMARYDELEKELKEILALD